MTGAASCTMSEGEPVYQTYSRGGTVRRLTGEELARARVRNARRRRLLVLAVAASMVICIGVLRVIGDFEGTGVLLLAAPLAMRCDATCQNGTALQDELNEYDPRATIIIGDSAAPDEFERCDSGGNVQLRLLHIVDNDDRILQQTPDATWFHLLRNMDWQPYRRVAAMYYDELYHSNLCAVKARSDCEAAACSINPETKEQARQRVLFERPVMGNEDAAKLYDTPSPEAPHKTDPEDIAPGRIPPRLAGLPPKDFFSLLKAFLGVNLMGIAPEPKHVHQHLTNNPAFARACGFTPRDPRGIYRQTATPVLRTLEHFDQIMTKAGLWSELKYSEINQAIRYGAIKPDDTLVHDTTHYHAHSSFEVVKCTDENGKTKKKATPKVTKRCGCKHKEQCPHEWESADEGAGTVVKSSGMHWGHKGSVLSQGNNNVVLDAYAVTDAATHDSTTLEASIARLFEMIPEIKEWFRTVLDDGAADDKSLKKRIFETFGLRLVCSQNPRRRKAITENLPRGVAKITPYGVPVCLAGHDFDFKGTRKNEKKFIFGPPPPVDGHTPCIDCHHKAECCPNATTGRHITLPYEKLPFIDPKDPPLAKRYRKLLAKRTSIERLIKILKCDLGDDTLSKRGNDAFQARLDKTLFAYFILLQYRT